jgi:tRNA(His) 5'-end guanylyltransferase
MKNEKNITIKHIAHKKKSKDSLSDRMKSNYENRSKTYLTRRIPVILRLDGKAFHTYLKGFKRPYDEFFHRTMNSTMEYLCKNLLQNKILYVII